MYICCVLISGAPALSNQSKEDDVSHNSKGSGRVGRKRRVPASSKASSLANGDQDSQPHEVSPLSSLF